MSKELLKDFQPGIKVGELKRILDQYPDDIIICIRILVSSTLYYRILQKENITYIPLTAMVFHKEKPNVSKSNNYIIHTPGLFPGVFL